MTENIRKIRESRGLTRPQLAERMGVSVSQITKLERGERRITTDWLASLASALGVRATELLDEGPVGLSRIPILAWVSAGDLATNDGAEIGTIEVAGLPAGDWIALKVEGTSMDRISPPESLIVVDRADKRLVANACYVIADADGQATYKRYRPSPMRFEPVSTDTSHEPIFPDQEPIVVGRARMSILYM